MSTAPATEPSRAPFLVIDGDDGWFHATVETAGGPVDITLDLLRAARHYGIFCQRHADNEEERGAAWVAWLTANGVPPLTHGAAFRLAAELLAAANELDRG